MTAEAQAGRQPRGHGDAELVRDVFWDLFRQGFITLGLNDSNPNWPWFRLSHFGERALKTQSPYRFHDTGSFIGLVRTEVPDISPEAVVYPEEAVAALYAGCLLACCVMLGVAAEAEFLRLLDVAAKNATYRPKFAHAKAEFHPAEDDKRKCKHRRMPAARRSCSFSSSTTRRQVLPGRQAIAIPIRERLLVRFNAAFFNILNHPGDPNSVGSTGVL